MEITQQLEIASTSDVVEKVATDLEKLKPNVILETLKQLFPFFLQAAYQILTVIIIFIIGRFIINLLKRGLKKSLSRINMDLGVKKFVISLFVALSYAVLVLIIAGRIGINTASIVAVLGSAGLAIGLALQGSLGNFAGGVIILFMKPFMIGDFIKTNVGEGVVSSIGLIYTSLITPDNKKIIIPNASLSNGALTNMTANPIRRVDILVGISYNSDLKLAKKIIERTYKNNSMILKDKDVEAFVDSLADSAVILGGRGWCNTPDYLNTKFRIIEEIKLEFDKEGIVIPFNQLDINIKRD